VSAEPRTTLAWALRIAKIALVVGVVIAAVSVRVVVAGEREIALSTAALRAGDPHDAALHARRAAGSYAPGAPHVRVAYERLLALAAKAEGVGDRETALFAWRGVRTAALETRWVVTPHQDDLERANAAIARLEAAQARPPGTRTDPAATIERAELAALTLDEAPHVPWVIALVAGFLAWTLGAAFVVRRGVTSTGQLVWQNTRTPLAIAAAGVVVWLLAIWRA
jgi:hypothetical protein